MSHKEVLPDDARAKRIVTDVRHPTRWTCVTLPHGRPSLPLTDVRHNHPLQNVL